MAASEVHTGAPAARGLRWPRYWGVAVALALAGLLFLRDPGRLLNPQFHAEDGSIFFLQAHEQGFWRTLVTPTAGYLNTLPRLVAGLARPFPVRAAPLVYALAAFAIQVTPILYLLGNRLGRYLPDRRARVLAAALFVAAPNSYATYAALTNSQWNLAIVGLLLLLADPPSGRVARVLEALLLAVFALTGPFSVILLPALLVGARGRARTAGKSWFALQTAIIAGGAAVQGVFLLTTPRAAPAVAQGAGLSLREVVQILSTSVFYPTVLGVHGTIEAFPRLGFPAHLAGVAVATFLACLVVARGHRALTLLLYLASSTILLSFLFPVSELRGWLLPGFGPRYYLFATYFLLFTLLLLALQGGRLRPVGVLLALPVLGIGIPMDIWHPRHLDTRWPDQMAVFESLPRGSSLYIPLQPEGYGGISVRKKTSQQAAPPLQELPRLAGETPCAIDPLELVTSPSWGDGMFLQVTGWATDALEPTRVPRVWVALDDRLFPAVSGLEEPGAAARRGDSRYRSAGFSRYVPLGDIGLGRHRLALIVLPPGRNGYFLVPGKAFSVTRAGLNLAVTQDP